MCVDTVWIERTQNGILQGIEPDHPLPVVGHVRHADDEAHKEEHDDRIGRQDRIGHLTPFQSIKHSVSLMQPSLYTDGAVGFWRNGRTLEAQSE